MFPYDILIHLSYFNLLLFIILFRCSPPYSIPLLSDPLYLLQIALSLYLHITYTPSPCLSPLSIKISSFLLCFQDLHSTHTWEFTYKNTQSYKDLKLEPAN